MEQVDRVSELLERDVDFDDWLNRIPGAEPLSPMWEYVCLGGVFGCFVGLSSSMLCVLLSSSTSDPFTLQYPIC